MSHLLKNLLTILNGCRVYLLETLRYSVTIETNKATRQKTTIDNDFVAPAGYDHEGGRHKIPAKNEKALN